MLALGGSLEIGKPGQNRSRSVMVKADLPADYSQVRRVSLAAVKPLDKLPEPWPLLSKLNSAQFDRLVKLDLSLGCPNLTDLIASNLAELKHLKRLSLAGCGLSDPGLKHLAALTNLESLDLCRTKATATGIAELQAALPNCQIERDATQQ